MKNNDSSVLVSLPFSQCSVRRRQMLSSNPTGSRLPTAYRWLQIDDDDDDPPPCPAVISPAPRLPPSGAEVELEAA
jgi:hypothetical protein